MTSWISAAHSQNYSWTTLSNSPYSSGRFENIHFINGNTGWLIDFYGVVYNTKNGGNSWTRLDSIYLGSFRSVVFIDSLRGWIGSLNQAHVLFETTDGGFNWNIVQNISGDAPRGICGIHALNSNFIYGCGRYDVPPSHFIKSTNGGTTWVSKDMSQYASALIDCYFFNENTGIAIGGQGQLLQTRLSRVLYTSDGGDTWDIKYTGSRSSEWGWKISFVDDMNGFVSLERLSNPNKYFLKTTNGGLSWIELPFVSANEQGIGFINTSTGWIGGNIQPTYGTTNGGTSWFVANIGNNINRFQMFGDTLGYACGQYVYKFSKSVGIVQLNTNVPDKFFLSQNFPNPFNPSTRISFGVTKNSHIELIVYDLLGREILTPVNQWVSSGSYEVEIDMSPFESGIYFYRLSNSVSSSEQELVRKMILIK